MWLAVGGYLEPEELVADVGQECHEAVEVYMAAEVCALHALLQAVHGAPAFGASSCAVRCMASWLRRGCFDRLSKLWCTTAWPPPLKQTRSRLNVS